MTNASLLLEHAPDWKDVLAYDEFSLRIVALRPTPWGQQPTIWTSHDDTMTQEWLQRAGLYVGPEITVQALEHIARKTAVHPVRDYLNGLAWDGKPGWIGGL